MTTTQKNSVTFKDGSESILKIAAKDRRGYTSNEVNLMQAEINAMKLVAVNCSFKVADVQYYDTGNTICDGNYFFMEKLEGDNFFLVKDGMSEDHISNRRNGMKKKKKILAVVITASILANVVSYLDTRDVVVRTAEVDPIDMSNRFVGDFVTSEIKTSADDSTVSLVATSKYSSDDILFDNINFVETKETSDEMVSLTDDEIENMFEDEELVDEEALEEVIEDYERDNEEETYNEEEKDIVDDDLYKDAVVEYECTFDMNDLVFNFEAELVDEDGTVLKTESIETDAIITENGGLDACILIDGNEYMMSDYENTSSIDDCSIAPVLNVVNAYLAVAETAEKIKAKSNYKYNQKLENDGKGVKNGYYVYSQSNTTTKNRKAGSYRFGFTTFKNVGCEVASAYNIALALGESERLSQTIYYFEAYTIEFAIGWGNLGSNPIELHRFLKARGFKYTKYISWKKFKKAVTDKKNCNVIMSRWNKQKSSGLHTFFVKKEKSSTYYGYNWSYNSTTKSRSKMQQSISDFNNGSGFIVGYIVWK